jgi:hypothetical protein
MVLRCTGRLVGEEVIAALREAAEKPLSEGRGVIISLNWSGPHRQHRFSRHRTSLHAEARPGRPGQVGLLSGGGDFGQTFY